MEDQINLYFRKLFREARDLISSAETLEDADNLSRMFLKFSGLHEKFSDIPVLLENLKQECHEKSVEIQEEKEMLEKLNEKKGQGFGFAFCGKHKNMSWGELSDIEDKRNNVVLETETTENALAMDVPENVKIIRKVSACPLPGPICVPISSRIGEIPDMFSWYQGDKKNKQGVYVKVGKMIIQVPFPGVVDITQNSNRTRTIKCKYETKPCCAEARKYLAEKYKTEVRECFFAHVGERYNKMGTNFRCPANPRFGDPEHLISDLKTIGISDIKMILMYALSDIMACHIWTSSQAPNENMILCDIDICN